LVGPYAGLLDNSGERIRLLKPDAPPIGDPTAVPYLLVDEVNYQTVPPWPTSPNLQTGDSLTRLEASIYGNDFSNWIGAPGTPGNSSLAAPTIVAGDFNLDGQRNDADISAMLLALINTGGYQAMHNATSADLAYIGDLNGDHTLRNSDLQLFLDLLAQPVGGGGGAGAAAVETSTTTSTSTAIVPNTSQSNATQPVLSATVEVSPQTSPVALSTDISPQSQSASAPPTMQSRIGA